MKFSSYEDIEAPIAFVFDAVTDIAGFERAALRRGVDLKRLDALTVPGPGMSWDVAFRFRGKKRKLIADIIGFQHPELIEFSAVSTSFELTLLASTMALSRRRTRLTMALDLRPRSLGARLMLQSVKLGRGNLKRKFADRVRTFSQDIETRAAVSATSPGA